VAQALRTKLRADYDIAHVTLQVDHADDALHRADNCSDAHGEIHVSPSHPS
jgi:hypothetical protein